MATKMSNYPGGFPQGLTVRGISVLNTYPKEVFWVCSNTGSDGNKGTFTRPFATIDYAIGRCTASRGSVILVKAGHAETLTAAGDIACDVAGVAIVGLGVGSNRPVLTFASTDNSASILVTAANVAIENIIGVCSDDGLSNPFHIQAADCYLDIEWRDGSATVEAASVVVTTAAGDRLNAKVKHIGFTAGSGNTSCVKLVGATDCRIDMDFYGNATTAVVNFASTACTNIEIEGYFYNEDTALTKNVVDSVGGTPCTWFAKGYDGKGGYSFSGGSAAALASDDVSSISTALAVVDGYHDVATANTSTNTVMRDVIGNKTDAAKNVVGTTNSVMALLKGVVNEITVATADTSANGFVNDVVGNKSDAAATGAVGTSTSLMAYAKQLVGGQIIIDAFHDVPTADTSTNAQMRDVLGNKTDAAKNVVGTTNSVIALVKGLVNEVTVATADTSANDFINDVIGNKSDAAAAGAVGTSDSIMALLKQVVTGSRTGAWIDGPTYLHPNYFAVSAPFTSATWNTTAADHEIVTVTGLVRMRVLPVCSGDLGGPANLRISLGTSAAASSFINDTTVTGLDDGEIWMYPTAASNTAGQDYSVMLDKIVNGVDVGYSLTNAAAASSGILKFHVWWEPLETGATCAAGAGGTLA